MSDEPSASTKESFEQVSEVQQEESQLTAEAEAVVEPQTNVEDQAKSTGSDTSDVSVIPDSSTQPQQRPPEESADIQDSQESCVSSSDISTGSPQTWETGRSNGTELQESWATCDGSGTESQQSCVTGQLPLDNATSTDASGMESTQGCDKVTETPQGGETCSGMESQQSSLISAVDKQIAQSTVSLGGSSIESGDVIDEESQLLGEIGSTQGCDNVTETPQGGETCSGMESQQSSSISAVDKQIAESTVSPGGSSIETGEVIGEESQLLGETDGDRRISQASVSTTSTYSGDSRETALVCDSSSGNSQVTGNVNGVPNSPDSPENPDNGVEVAAPSGRLTRREVRENQEEGGIRDQSDGCACECHYLRPLSRRIRQSKTFMYFQLLLLLLQLTNIYLGVKYLSFCPVNKDLPVFLVIQSIMGSLLLVGSLGLGTRHLLCPCSDKGFFKTLLGISCFFFAVLLLAGMRLLQKVTPAFDPSVPETYCDMVFYNYMFYTNYISIGLPVLFLFVYIPTWNESIEGYERI